MQIYKSFQINKFLSIKNIFFSKVYILKGISENEHFKALTSIYKNTVNLDFRQSFFNETPIYYLPKFIEISQSLILLV